MLSLSGRLLLFYCKIRGAPAKLKNQPRPISVNFSQNICKLSGDPCSTFKSRYIDHPKEPGRSFQVFYFKGVWALRTKKFLQVLRAFGIPQRKHLYFISVSGAFLGTSLPPTPNWSRFDLFIDVYSIFYFIYCISSYTLYFVFFFTCHFFLWE